jgi:hypothetical protein
VFLDDRRYERHNDRAACGRIFTTRLLPLALQIEYQKSLEEDPTLSLEFRQRKPRSRTQRSLRLGDCGAETPTPVIRPIAGVDRKC